MSLRASGAVEKALIYPPAPQGGSCNIQYINKSPLGDLGVKKPGGTFSTAPWGSNNTFTTPSSCSKNSKEANEFLPYK